MVTVDFGCGWDKFQDAVGIDLCPYNRDIKADALRSPLRDSSVDLVISRQFIEHVDAQTHIRECWRVLKPQGKLYLQTPNALYIFRILRAFRNKEPEACPYHIQTFTSNELRNILNLNGFDVDSVAFKSWGISSPLKRLIALFSNCIPMLRKDICVYAKKVNRPFNEYIHLQA